jgi:hypothetical protein
MPEDSESAPPALGAPRKHRTILWLGLGIAAIVGVLLLIPRIQSLNEPPRYLCKNRLRQIGIALHLYADDNGGFFSPDLVRLFPTYTDNAGNFSCPSSPSTWQDFLPGGTVTESSSSYTYVPGLAAGMPGPFIVAYDKSLLNHRKLGLNYLCLDSSVVWRRIADKEAEAEFQRRLVLQAEAVAKWRASGKPVKALGEFISPELQELMAK